MDQEKLEKFKTRLEGELVFAETELRSLGHQNPGNEESWDASMDDIDTTATEPDEVADRMEEYEEDREELAAIQKHWHNIKRALTRIEDGSFGICEISGEPIEEDRLEANPSARTCKAHMEQEGELAD